MKNFLIIFSFTFLLFESAQAFICPLPPPGAGGPNVAKCKNSEFQSCGINVNGITRHFCIHVPSDGAGAPAGQSDPLIENLPVIFGFHGGGGDASKMVKIWDKHTEQGMVLIAPSALVSGNGTDCKPAWRGIRKTVPTWADLANPDACGFAVAIIPPKFAVLPYQTGGANHNDLDLVRIIGAAINADQQIQPTGFYASGFSSGAGMVYQLFITQPHVTFFSGFMAVSNNITQAKIDAQAAAAGIPGYQPNHDIRKPFLFIMGTNEKLDAPGQNIVEFVDTQAVPGGICPPVTSALEVIRCWSSHPTYPSPGVGKHEILTPSFITTRWLVNHNNSLERPLESLYPDVGHGDAPYSQSDHTISVRQDFMKKPRVDNSAPVAVIRILDGGHVWPGQNGNHPPCNSGNCDIDATEVVLQFWRANAGFRNNWP